MLTLGACEVHHIDDRGPESTRRPAHQQGMTNEHAPGDRTILGWHDLRTSDRVALTPTEVARLLGVDRRTISRAIEDGDLPGVRIGRKIVISREALVRKFEAAA
jgi:excisionase family DNA binding protein